MMRALGFLVAASVALTVAAIGQDMTGDVDAGARLARELCAMCHVVSDDQSQLTRSDQFPDQEQYALYAPAFADVAADPAVTAMSLRFLLQTPHLRMPDLHLAPQETDDVSAYILSLK